MFEGHGDGGAEDGRVGERAVVDGEAVIVVGLDAVGVGHVDGVDIGAKGARSRFCVLFNGTLGRHYSKFESNACSGPGE